jgi:hypothetical protein
MSTTGKTTDGTCLNLKIAQEEIAALKVGLSSQNNPSMIMLPPDTMIEESEEMDIDNDAQILQAALNVPHQEEIDQDSDAMEEDQHPTVYIGSNLLVPSTTDEPVSFWASPIVEGLS